MTDPFLLRTQARIWDDLVDAPQSHSSLQLFTLATAEPSLRLMMLRGANPVDRLLTFYTDVRSDKITAIKANPKIAMLFWEPRIREQIRITATATVHTDNAISAECWANLAPNRWREYSTLAPPGAVVADPSGGHSRVEVVEAAKANFAVVHCAVTQIDWMELGPAAEHKRARFTWEDGAWNRCYLVP